MMRTVEDQSNFTASLPTESISGSAAVSPPDPPAALVIPPNPGETITSELTGNTYTMGEKIGEGFFGLVYSCVDVWNIISR
jgi:hypothetical protein